MSIRNVFALVTVMSIMESFAINSPNEEPAGLSSSDVEDSPSASFPLLSEPLLTGGNLSPKSPSPMQPQPSVLSQESSENNLASSSRMVRSRENGDEPRPSSPPTSRIRSADQIAQLPPGENLRQRMDQPGMSEIPPVAEQEESEVQNIPFFDIRQLSAEDRSLLDQLDYIDNNRHGHSTISIDEQLREFDALGRVLYNIINNSNPQQGSQLEALSQQPVSSRSTNSSTSGLQMGQLMSGMRFEIDRIDVLMSFLLSFLSSDDANSAAIRDLMGTIRSSFGVVKGKLSAILANQNQKLHTQQNLIEELSQRLQAADNRQVLNLHHYFSSSSSSEENSEIILSDEARDAVVNENDSVIIADVFKKFDNTVNYIDGSNFELFSELVLALLNHNKAGPYTKAQVQKVIASTLGII